MHTFIQVTLISMTLKREKHEMLRVNVYSFIPPQKKTIFAIPYATCIQQLFKFDVEM